jgi:transcriptional regulator with XRE-family HTH domain
MNEDVVDLATRRVTRTGRTNERRNAVSLSRFAASLANSPEIWEGKVTAKAAVHSAKILRDMRKFARLTQAELAKALGIKQSRVAYLESGKSVQGPTISTLYRVAHVCGVRISLSFDATEDKERPKHVRRSVSKYANHLNTRHNTVEDKRKQIDKKFG